MTNTTNPTPDQLADFVEYCRSFYAVDFTGDDDEVYPLTEAIYPFASTHEITRAVMEYVPVAVDFCGDSCDREAVRDLICAHRRRVGIGEPDFDKAVAQVAIALHL
jgi:hypothetical protein